MSPLGNDLNLGTNAATGEDVKFSAEKRSTHLYVCGTTGTGKTKFLENLIWQDIRDWRTHKSGLLLIDPHGSLYDSIVARMARERLERPLVTIDLRNSDWILAYNLLRHRAGAEAGVVVGNFLQAITHVWGQKGIQETPLFGRWATNVLRTLYDARQTLTQAQSLLDQQASAIRRVLSARVTSSLVAADWQKVEKLSASEFEDQIGSTLSRFRPFFDTEMLSLMFGQQNVSLDLGRAIEEGHIILVNLTPKPNTIGDKEAALFATLLLDDLWTAAKTRGKGTDRNPVKPFRVYVDEFQEFVTPTIGKNLDQARGFGLHLTLAHQYPKQLLNAGPHGKAIYDSIMVNARSKVVFQMEEEENLRPLAQSLFMGAINLEEIKLALYATKIMGHQREIRRSISQSSSVNESYSEGTSQTRLSDGTISDRVSERSSTSYGKNSGYSETEMEVDAAVFGRELSQVQFRSVEEQYFRAMVILFSQQKQRCIARLVGERLPVSISVPNVPSHSPKVDIVKRYVEKNARKWAFLLPFAQAKIGLKSSDDALKKLAQEPDGEPKTAKRKLD